MRVATVLWIAAASPCAGLRGARVGRPAAPAAPTFPVRAAAAVSAAAAAPPPPPAGLLDFDFLRARRALVKMTRPNTMPMGAGLVGVGAYGARARALPGARTQLLLAVLLTVIVTSSSMVINDYHDFVRGVDTEETKPGRPLVTREILPSEVKRALKWAYAAHLALLCLVDRAATRLWVLSSTLLTYLYSQHLKPVAGLKNFVCGATVAMAIGLGAMAASGGAAGLGAVWRPMAVAGGVISHREIVMDIKDADGDGATGVRTLPVAFGRDAALALSFVPLSLAGAVGLGGAGWLAVAPVAALGLLSARSRAAGYERPALSAAIESTPLWLLLALLALTR